MQFIDTLAAYLVKQEKENFEDVCLLVPGKRAGVYLHEAIMSRIDKPVWAPQIMTINELFLSLSQYQQADSLQLIFELFQVFREKKKSNEDFNQFYYWGEIMLNDFEDVDKYRVDAKQLFSNIKDIKEIENVFDYLTEEQKQAIEQFWYHYNSSKSSQLKKDFMAIWEVLGLIYESFKSRLEEKQLCYEGMAFREIAEQADKLNINIPYKKVYCIGFNILNECEHALFRYLQKSDKGVFFWDYDAYYLRDGHEAGRFIESNRRLYPAPEHPDIYNKLSSHTAENPKKIHASACLTQVSQVKLLPELLKEKGLNTKEALEKTVVVLCDEKLLLPLIQSIPDDISYNITMGFPFEQTPLYSFLNTVFDLHKSTKWIKDKPHYYYKHALSILSHQYMMGTDHEACNAIIRQINKENIVYFNAENIGNQRLLQLIFQPAASHLALITQIQTLIKELYLYMNQRQESGLDQEYLYLQYKQINRFSAVMGEINTISPLNLSTLKQLFFNTLAKLRVPFSGEPLRGMQIMGLLETRALDFDHVFMLSVNEGNLPKTTTSPSFIPYNLRRGYNLQTIEYQDSIYAYYFYRLIQRAETVHLSYSQESKGIGSNEKSRFLTQLEFDNTMQLQEVQQAYTIYSPSFHAIRIPKTGKTGDLLAQYLRNESLSASSLSCYMSCSLQFFFHYLAGLEERLEVTEEIDAAISGSIIHKTLETLYENKKHLEKADIDKMLKDKKHISEIVLKLYMEAHQIQDKEAYISGSNTLSLSIIENAIHQILHYDSMQAPFAIKELEKEVQYTKEYKQNGKVYQVSFKGYIDRLDYKDEALRVIDYKSGKAESSFTDLQQLFSSDNAERRNAIFQIIFYALAILDEFPQEAIIPAIYSLKKMSDPQHSTGISMKRKPLQIEDIKDEFNQLLDQVVAELLSTEIPFEQTVHTENCQYCSYRGICNR